MNSRSLTAEFLSLARLESLEYFSPWLRGSEADWAQAQTAFLEMTDDYVEEELAKAVTDNTQKHEAG